MGAIQRQVLEAPTAAPEATDRPTLRMGMNEEDVRSLKLELNVAGADPPLGTSTVFDESTRKALIEFQRGHGLSADGVAGPKTWGKLDFIARDRVLQREELAEYIAARKAASVLIQAGDFVGAQALLLALYRNPKATPELRKTPTFNLGTCEHNLGKFDAAIGFYEEFLDLPNLDSMSRRDANERIRQARNQQPPGKLESTLTEEREADLAAQT